MTATTCSRKVATDAQDNPYKTKSRTGTFGILLVFNIYTSGFGMQRPRPRQFIFFTFSCSSNLGGHVMKWNMRLHLVVAPAVFMFHAVALWSCQPEMAPSNGLAQIHVESRQFRLVFGSLEHVAPLFFSVLSSPPHSLYIQWSVLTGRPYLRCPCAPTDLAICARVPSVLCGTGVNL